MARDEPLTLQSLSPDVVEAARAAAAASGLTLDEWLNRTILGIVGGFAAARNGGRRSDPPEGRWADPLSSISQNLKTAADAASAAGITFEQWLSEAILTNTTVVARQGRTSEEPNLSLFRAPLAARPGPRVVPIRDSVTVPTPASPPPAAASKAKPADEPDKPVAWPPGDAPSTPIPDLPSFRDVPTETPEPPRQVEPPEIPDVVVAPPTPDYRPSPLFDPDFLNDLAERPKARRSAEKPEPPTTAARVEPTVEPPRAEPTSEPLRVEPTIAPWRTEPTAPTPDADPTIVPRHRVDAPATHSSDIPDVPPDSDEPVFDDPTIPDTVLDKRLAQIIADAREEVAAMARNAPQAPQPRPTPIIPTMDGGRRAPRQRRDRSWLTVAALLVLAVVAAAVWVLPKLPQLGVQFEKKPDFVQQLPTPGATARRDPASVDKIENLPLNKPGETKPAVGESTGEVLPEPPSQHVAVYRQAATAGNVKAQVALAQLYLRGEGVTKDLAEAARWYREAASKHNDANAQYALGVLLDRGIGVEKDPIEALLWFQRAAQQGHPAALTNTGVAYSKGEVVPRDYAKAATYFQRAAEAGVAQAQFNLGLLYENGLGVQKDPVQAYRWFSAAAKGGDPGAPQALERLMPTMSADDLARAKDLVGQAAGKP
jgi:TPR repeat protein